MNQTLRKTGTIAIVDDDEPLREALGSVLRAAGYPIEMFGSGEQLLESDRRKIACLILDVRLPGMSGIELQRRLIDANRAVPIVFVTAHGDAALRDLAMQAGASGFLNKPVRSDALLKQIRVAIERGARKTK
ncbi:MAG: response regulator [Candidatus Sulfotelmatobacter sp.]